MGPCTGHNSLNLSLFFCKAGGKCGTTDAELILLMSYLVYVITVGDEGQTVPGSLLLQFLENGAGDRVPVIHMFFCLFEFFSFLTQVTQGFPGGASG